MRPREERTEPSNHLDFLGGNSFQASRKGGVLGSPTKLRNTDKSWEVKTARTGEAECKDGRNCAEKESQEPSQDPLESS